MPSYAIIGGSRGVGLEFVRQLVSNAEVVVSWPWLLNVQTQAQDEKNTVFVTVRNKQRSTFLRDLVDKLPHRNVHILEADVVDAAALKARPGCIHFASITEAELAESSRGSGESDRWKPGHSDP